MTGDILGLIEILREKNVHFLVQCALYLCLLELKIKSTQVLTNVGDDFYFFWQLCWNFELLYHHCIKLHWWAVMTFSLSLQSRLNSIFGAVYKAHRPPQKFQVLFTQNIPQVLNIMCI